MSIKEYLKNSRALLFVRLLHEKWTEVCLLSRYIANGNRQSDPRKLATDLAIRAHAIEKGMSIGNVRAGFGIPKVKALITDLEHYLAIGGDASFACQVCGIIAHYVTFNEEMGAPMEEVSLQLEDFCEQHRITPVAVGGVYIKNFTQTGEEAHSTFDVFSQSRYSVRDFGTEPIALNTIEQAVKMCERTPSACNRQSWKIYIYADPKKRSQLFSLQGGCKGFDDDMQYAILVCGDIRGYNINELSQVYVDGGLYAMNLLYALHHLGVAAIPLTMGHKQRRVKEIKRQMGIPAYETPVVLIGAGSYKENYRVAASTRRDYKEYTVIK